MASDHEDRRLLYVSKEMNGVVLNGEDTKKLMQLLGMDEDGSLREMERKVSVANADYKVQIYIFQLLLFIHEFAILTLQQIFFKGLR